MTPNRYRQAIQLQDASNPCGVANTLLEMCREATRELNSTDAVRNDPAIRLTIHKLADLCGVGPMFDLSSPAWRQAFDDCERRADKA